eukprot:1157213-Pelagomonas_calceolata.AAC.2
MHQGKQFVIWWRDDASKILVQLSCSRAAIRRGVHNQGCAASGQERPHFHLALKNMRCLQIPCTLAEAQLPGN